MSDAVALNPITVSAGSGKRLIEHKNEPEEGAEGAAFTSLMQAMAQPAESLPAPTPGGELPGADATLPPDAAAALSATTPPAAVAGTAMGGVADMPAISSPNLAPNFSQWLAAGSRSPVLKMSNADPQALDSVPDDVPHAGEGGVLSPSFSESVERNLNSDAAASGLSGLGVTSALGQLSAPTANPADAAAGLSGLALPAERAASHAEAPKLILDSKLPLMSPLFADRFVEQVTILVDHGIKQAQLSLNPADLGPIQIRITLSEDAASVQFASHHGVVREAMLDALPKLREMLESAGFRLSDSGVSAQLPQREQLGSEQPGMGRRAVAPDPWVEPEILPRSGSRALHLIDAYV